MDRVEYAPAIVLGMDCTQAVAYLREGLFPESVRPKTLTSQPDGAGSHKSAQVACHMAVSEALERWAVLYCRANPKLLSCAMEIDGSSNGFAAFPGLFKRQARKAALRESIERHCLISWWEGYLGHHPLPDPKAGVRAIQLENPFSSHTVVVMCGLQNERHTFAFGAGSSLNHSIWRASVEMERTQLLTDCIAEHKALRPDDSLNDLFERRIDFFASATGFSLFLNRLEAVYTKSIDRIRMLYDAPVSGPWDKYASVWRTVIEPPSREYLSEREDYFFW